MFGDKIIYSYDVINGVGEIIYDITGSDEFIDIIRKDNSEYMLMQWTHGCSSSNPDNKWNIADTKNYLTIIVNNNEVLFKKDLLVDIIEPSVYDSDALFTYPIKTSNKLYFLNINTFFE